MTMFDEERGRRMIRNRIAGLVYPVTVEFQWQGQGKHELPDPVEGNAWIREYQDGVSEDLIANNYVRSQYLTTFSVFVPRGTGTETMSAITKLIGDQLRPALQLSDGDCSIRIDRTFRSGALNDRDSNGAWTFQNVQVAWRAHTLNV